MKIEEFEKLKKEYRVCCEFYYSEEKEKFVPIEGSACIFGHKNRVKIYPIVGDVIRILVTGSINYQRILEENGIEVVYYEELDTGKKFANWSSSSDRGESIVDFHQKDIHKVLEIVKAKKVQQPISIYSVRNINEFLRFQRHIHPKYGDILEQRIKDNRQKN